MQYIQLLQRIQTATQRAIRNQLRSDVYCKSIQNLVGQYLKAFRDRQEQSVFGGSSPEDYGKLAAADDGLSDEEYRRLRDADDQGRDELDDDGDVFG